jgi:hypothetical protein
MIVVIVLLGGVLLWMLASSRDATGLTAQDACIMTAVDDARAFAAVLGDDRAVPVSFAVRACAQP